MTECRDGCGSCCSPVILPYTQTEALRQVSDPRDADTLQWILHDLTPMGAKEAKAREPYLFDRSGPTKVMSPGEPAIPFFYRCRWFDDETRRCTNYENRPGACRDWPWKGDQPNPASALPPTCSFRADVGKPVALLPTRANGRVVTD